MKGVQDRRNFSLSCSWECTQWSYAWHLFCGPERNVSARTATAQQRVTLAPRVRDFLRYRVIQRNAFSAARQKCLPQIFESRDLNLKSMQQAL